MKRKIIIANDNGLTDKDYTDEEMNEWRTRTPAERFAFFLEISNFFCSLRKPQPPDPNTLELRRKCQKNSIQNTPNSFE